MPPLNIVENNEKVIEINHHLVHLNTHHYNDWTNPRDIFSTLLYHHAPGSLSGQFPPSSSDDGRGLGHHSHSHHNESHLGNTTPGSSHSGHSPPDLIDEAEKESLIVVYALFLPLLAALIFILIVALYVRRMRRSTSMQNVQMQNELYDFSLPPMKGSSSKGDGSSSASSSSSKNSQSRATSVKTSKSSKVKSIYLKRSISSMGLSSPKDKSSQNQGFIMEPEDKYNLYYYQLQQLQNQQQTGKRWNTSGFLNSTGSDDDCCSSSVENCGYTTGTGTSTSASGSTSSGSEIDIIRPEAIHVVDLGSPPTPNQVVKAELKRSSSSTSSSRKSLKTVGGRLLGIINIPKRIKQNNLEKKRFNIYTIPLETREQLKQIYVY